MFKTHVRSLKDSFDQESCLALEDLLLGKIWWGVYVCLWLWYPAPTELGTLFTASYSKVGTDSAMAVTLQDPEETRLPQRGPHEFFTFQNW